jgi:single-strand DNA-binding protein
MDSMLWMTGNVGSEVDLREVRDGLVYASFRLASTPRVWRSGEWTDGATTWLAVNCSKALAEHVKTSVNKGDPVVVAGRLRTSRWPDAQGVIQERQYIDAVAVGHDLNRGTSVFRKSSRQAVEESEFSVGEFLASSESMAQAESGDEKGTAA